MNNVQTKVKLLFEEVSKTTLTEPTGIFGSTPSQSLLMELMGSVVKLSMSLKNSKDIQDSQRKFTEMVQYFDTARITGLISDNDMKKYSPLIEEIDIALRAGDA